MSLLGKIFGKKFKLPANLNSPADVIAQSAALSELLVLIRKAAQNPTDITGWLHVRDKAHDLGLL